VRNGEVYNIGVVGPTMVGKTTLITAILNGCQQLLRGRPISMRALGTDTEAKIATNAKELEGCLLAGAFDAGNLRGTTESFVFELMLDPGVQGCEIRFAVLDYPGILLDPDERKRRGPSAQADWDECQRFIRESTILLVPIDSAVLMEATLSPHKRAVPTILDTFQVEQVASDWAQERNLRPDEPALLLLCPLKCESYFADNGGHRDQSEELQRRLRETYRSVLSAVREEAGGRIPVFGCPIDTIGCVSLMRAEWVPTDRPTGFGAHYRVRQPAVRSVKGVDDVFGLVCGHLVQAGRNAHEALRDGAKMDEISAREAAGWRAGFFENVWFVLSGERDRRLQEAVRAGMQASDATARVKALKTVVDEIAARPPSPRRFRL
jgi:hypothetical protein